MTGLRGEPWYWFVPTETLLARGLLPLKLDTIIPPRMPGDVICLWRGCGGRGMGGLVSASGQRAGDGAR